MIRPPIPMADAAASRATTAHQACITIGFDVIHSAVIRSARAKRLPSIPTVSYPGSRLEAAVTKPGRCRNRHSHKPNDAGSTDERSHEPQRIVALRCEPEAIPQLSYRRLRHSVLSASTEAEAIGRMAADFDFDLLTCLLLIIGGFGSG